MVRSTERPKMTIAVDWDIKHQIKQTVPDETHQRPHLHITLAVGGTINLKHTQEKYVAMPFIAHIPYNYFG